MELKTDKIEARRLEFTDPGCQMAVGILDNVDLNRARNMSIQFVAQTLREACGGATV
jgi:hypothetical protein